MIDVPALSPIQVIYFAIEKSGDIGKRICELRRDTNGAIGERDIYRYVSKLQESGDIVKVRGSEGVPRYYSTATPVSTPDKSVTPTDKIVSTPDKSVTPTDKIVSTPDKSVTPTDKIVSTPATPEITGLLALMTGFLAILSEKVASLALTKVSDSLTEMSVSEPVNMLTVNNINLTKQTKGDSNFSEKTQAEVSTLLGGEAGTADEEFNFLSDSSVPAEPLAPNPPEAPETPPKIDATLFADQTGQSLPKAHVAAPVQPKLFHGSSKKENTFGTVFLEGKSPTDSLYQMFENMAGKVVPNPKIIYNLSDVGKAPEMIPAEEAFANNVRIMWALIRNTAGTRLNGEYRWENAIKTRDFLVHRAAYLFVMAPWETNKKIESWTPDQLDAEVRNRRTGAYYNNLLGILKDRYEKAGYGWDTTNLGNEITWYAEVDRYGDDARSELFPSRDNNVKYWKKQGDHSKKSIRSEFTSCPATSAEQVRIDTAHGPPRDPVLANIHEKIGEGRYDLWFGGATCEVIDGKPVFTVRNQFTKDSILRHCSDALPEGAKFRIQESGDRSQEKGDELQALRREMNERVRALHVEHVARHLQLAAVH